MIRQMTIVNEGMCNFLNPPGDAEHNFSLREGRGDNAGRMALRYALTESWVPDYVKDAIRTVLAANPPRFEPSWEAKCYAYFKGCYSPDGVERNCGKLVHSGPPEYHLAFLHIRAFFPDYKPNEALMV